MALAAKFGPLGLIPPSALEAELVMAVGMLLDVFVVRVLRRRR